MTFVHLHTHSEYSILDGTSRVPDMVATAAGYGMPAIALTDHGSLSGAFTLWREANAHGIKPIIGCEFYVAPGWRFDKAPIFWGSPEQRSDDISGAGAYTHLTVLAQNAAGLRNLYRLSQIAAVEGFYRKPRIDLDSLIEHGDGLIILTGCPGGEIPTKLSLGLYSQARLVAGQLKDAFPNRVWVEIMDHGSPTLMESLSLLSRDLSLPMVATNDSHYTNQQDWRVQDAFICQREGLLLGSKPNPNSLRSAFSKGGFHLRSPNEMSKLLLPSHKCLTETLSISSNVDSYDEVFTSRPEDLMPRHWENYPSPEAALSWLAHSLGYALSDEHHDQIDREISVIADLGYCGYFLVLHDLISWAKRGGILCGPGRGSAAGSVVAYALGITDVDPLEYGLVFERFLNPSRKSPPDIDIDIQDDRRNEVLLYAADRYGYDYVAQLITFGTLGSKAAIKDSARVLGRTAKEGQELANLVPDLIRGRQEALGGLNKLAKKDPEVYELALGLEGLIRQTGRHAAAMIISPEKLSDIIPVTKTPADAILASGYEMAEIESLGLIKYDLLGLRNLTVIQQTLGMIDD